MADEDEVGESGDNGTNLSNPSALTRSTGAGYLTSRGAKKSGGNTKKGVKVVRGFDYLTLAAKKVFNHLRHVFIQALIFQDFDPERHIRIEIDASGYVIGAVLSQLTLDDLGQRHPVAYYSRKMILAKIRYKTHNDELLAIVEVFKTWRYYLKCGKHKVFVFTNHNNLWKLMDIKSLSFCQVRSALKLSCYHFWINYCQGKGNGAADALSYFLQQDDDEKANFWAENIQILHCL